jgi:hypothetical protein
MQESIDDTLPLPADVEPEFLKHVGDGLSAETATWLEDRGIDPAPINSAALIQYGFIWNPSAGRYDFRVYDADHIGPKRRPVLAVPIIEGGEFIDLLLIGDDKSFEMVTHRAPWLGIENIKESVRLHAHPLQWLKAGCTGACHVALISRAALKDLRNIESIVCNDIGTALEAWSWAFDADEAELSRFEVDDTPVSINEYYERAARWHAIRVANDIEARHSW